MHDNNQISQTPLSAQELVLKGKKELHRLIQRRTKRGLKKIEKMHQELTEATRSDQLKHIAETLLANRHVLTRGLSEIRLANIYDTAIELHIPLNPAKSLQDNIERYFTQYRKAQHRLTKLPLQIASAETSLATTQASLELVEALTSLKELEQVTAALTAQGILPPPPGTRTKDKKTGRKVGYREYITLKGWHVLVGKTDADNDYLTFKIAGPHDYWFHVDGAPGSHTVLKLKSKNTPVDHQTLCEAASIAAWYSKQRNALKVGVSYTQRKFVRKPKRAKAGTVIIEREKTVYVAPGLPKETPSKPTDNPHSM